MTTSYGLALADYGFEIGSYGFGHSHLEFVRCDDHFVGINYGLAQVEERLMGVN
jgi:hypothetical protein